MFSIVSILFHNLIQYTCDHWVMPRKNILEIQKNNFDPDEYRPTKIEFEFQETNVSLNFTLSRPSIMITIGIVINWTASRMKFSSFVFKRSFVVFETMLFSAKWIWIEREFLIWTVFYSYICRVCLWERSTWNRLRSNEMHHRENNRRERFYLSFVSKNRKLFK